MATLALVVAANLWALRDPVRFDLTSGDVYSISPQTRRVIESLSDPVTITYFYDLRSKGLLDAKALLEQYADLSDQITLRAYDPALQPAEARRHQVHFAGTLVVESRGRRIVSSGAYEADFTNALLRATKNAAQKICFTDGHVESDPFSLASHDHMEDSRGQGHGHSTGGRPLEVHERHGMGMARDALETLGYEVASVLLVQQPHALAGCSVVVIASPQRPFLPREVDQLVDHLLAGGRAVLLLEPAVEHGLERVLDLFGIVMSRAGIVDPEAHYWTDPGTPAVSRYARHRVTRNLPLTFFPGAAALAARPGGIPDDVRVTPLVRSSAGSRLETAARAGDDASRERPRDIMVHASKRLAGGDMARVLVAGDGDFASNSFFPVLGNGQLFLNAVSHLAEQEDLIDIQPRSYALPRMELSNRQMTFTFVASAIVLPALVLLSGLVVWWRSR